MQKHEYAAELHTRGCNCAQSVACAFAEELGMDTETVMKIAEGFGLGCGGMQSMCGALSGAIMVAGAKTADGNIEAPKTKKNTYAIAKKLCDAFEKECGALLCRDLKGTDTGKVLMPCPKCIEIGVRLAEEVLGGKYDGCVQ